MSAAEAQLFLPTSNNQQNSTKKNFRSPPLASLLFRIFEKSNFYGCLIFLSFSYAVYIGTLTTYEKHQKGSEPILFYVELSIFLYTSLEFLLRIYGSKSRKEFRQIQGFFRFFFEHYLFFDLILLVLYGLTFSRYFLGFWQADSASFLHSLRFLQLIRFISLDRYFKSIPLLSETLWNYRRVLLATTFLCFLLMLPTAYLLWVVERDIQTDEKFFFKTFTDSLWYTINSMATIGYGDTWPQTLTGRFLTVTLCCAGVVLWTLPAGIISSSLTATDDKDQHEKNSKKPAAKLIFNFWRYESLRRRAHTIRRQDLEQFHCKLALSYLIFRQSLREFRRHHYGLSYELSLQLKSDIQQLFQRLQAIENKIDGIRYIDD